MQKPERGECADYYFTYIDKVPDGDVLLHLGKQIEKTAEFLGGISEDRADYRYAEGKWSTKEVVGHLNDTERVFAYRALWFARNNTEPIPGMEQDDFVRHGHFEKRSLASLTDEFRSIRQATLSLVRGFSEEVNMRTGTASGVEFTVRSIPWIIAGHELHHIAVLKEKYL